MTKNERIFKKYDDGEILLKEALFLISKLPKPWKRKEWKEKRSLIIKKECEKCGNSGIMVLNHTWHPRTAHQIRKEYIQRHIKFNQNSFDSWLSYYKDKKAWKYISVLSDEDKKERFLNARILKDQFYKKNEEKTEDYVFRECFKGHQRYMSMEDTQTLCKSCASKYDYNYWAHKQLIQEIC